MRKVNKKILEYPAVFEPALEGGFNVSFPQFPGCVTFGRNFEEAKEKAVEILELWLEELSTQGEQIIVARERPIIDEIKVAAPAKAKISYAPNHC